VGSGYLVTCFSTDYIDTNQLHIEMLWNTLRDMGYHVSAWRSGNLVGRDTILLSVRT